jgi:hypothetical protein
VIEYREWIAVGLLMLGYFSGFAYAYYIGRQVGYDAGLARANAIRKMEYAGNRAMSEE